MTACQGGWRGTAGAMAGGMMGACWKVLAETVVGSSGGYELQGMHGPS